MEFEWCGIGEQGSQKYKEECQACAIASVGVGQHQSLRLGQGWFCPCLRHNHYTHEPGQYKVAPVSQL